MYWKDIINDSDEWIGLRIEVIQDAKSNFILESGANCRFKLNMNEKPILWGTFGCDYWGVWILNNKEHWQLSEMPIMPINSNVVQSSIASEYSKFWSKYFTKQLIENNSSSLSSGIWTITTENENTSCRIRDVESVFEKRNPRWIEWDIGRCGSIVALKEEPNDDSGRVKWFRKLVREEICPPVLVWYLSCLDGYILIDGHSRLKAFQMESISPRFLILNSIVEKEKKPDIKIQESILKGIEKRQKHQVKSKMNIDEVNRLLISAFDTRPYCRPITNAKAKRNYEDSWTEEVKGIGEVLNLNTSLINDMIARTEE